MGAKQLGGLGGKVAAADMVNPTAPVLLQTCRFLAAAFLVSAPMAPASAAESAFSAYGLGTSAFTAGVTPPPGAYVSGGLAYIRGDINGALTFGGIEMACFSVLSVMIIASSATTRVRASQPFLTASKGMWMQSARG